VPTISFSKKATSDFASSYLANTHCRNFSFKYKRTPSWWPNIFENWHRTRAPLHSINVKHERESSVQFCQQQNVLRYKRQLWTGFEKIVFLNELHRDCALKTEKNVVLPSSQKSKAIIVKASKALIYTLSYSTMVLV